MEAVTTTLDDLPAPLTATNSDSCPNCGAGMAPDQRYCINCGERRTGGSLRDALPRTRPVAATAPPAGPRTAWLHSSSGSLIAGVATLLLAMGVGVLIGRSGHDNTSAAAARQPVQVVTVAGSGAAGTTTGAAATTASTAGSKSSKSKKSSKAKVSGTSDVNKVAAQNHVKLPPRVVKVGGKCAAGSKGCQGGKFTGNFFGGG